MEETLSEALKAQNRTWGTMVLPIMDTEHVGQLHSKAPGQVGLWERESPVAASPLPYSRV